jgi:acetyl-CoA C-acetyltransferase
MRRVSILGVGVTRAGEHYAESLATLARQAAEAALEDAGGASPEALFVASAHAGSLAGQENLAAFLADRLDLCGAEIHGVEADAASGGSALRLAEIAVAGGAFETALVLAVEKVSDVLPDRVQQARARGLDTELDGWVGLTPAAAGGLLMARYLHEHRLDPLALAPFPRLAHENAVTAAHAFLRREISTAAYERGPFVARPLRLLDCAPEADGAAAVVISSAPPGMRAVRIRGSSVASGPLALAARRDPTRLETAERSARTALQVAQRSLGEVSFFELDDALSILAALSLEAVGACDRGRAVHDAARGRFARGGELPICTFGGDKARGNPIGAAGLYRIAEAVWQLRGEAGANQVRGAKVALVQSLGALGATAVTHVLE